MPLGYTIGNGKNYLGYYDINNNKLYYSCILNNRVVYNKSPLWGNFGKYKRPGNN